ncbi:hypothetical protein BDV93DRAFT_557146 [Ceratobasidium sp. AG-I]|nr:hypothetical protein BDV93DRAFT_557146 [Ceratobasidium sp. AG-I]
MFNKPRNKFIFPDGLTKTTRLNDPSITNPSHYSPADLCNAFLRDPKARKHVDKIVVESAFYCKQSGDPRHEFILLRVTDFDDRRTNFLLLDRTDPENNLAKIKVTRLASELPKPSTIEDRLLVSYYGDRQSLLKPCGLANHKVIEELDFAKAHPFLLYEVLFIASGISSECHTSAASGGEGYRFAHTLWAYWRKEIFHQFNLFDLAEIFLGARHNIILFCSASGLKHTRMETKTPDCSQTDISPSAVHFLHCLEQNDSPVDYMSIYRVSTHVISALYCKGSGLFEHEFIRLIVANEVNPSITGYIVLDRTFLGATLPVDQPPSAPRNAKNIILGPIPAIDRFNISTRVGQPPELCGKKTDFQVVECLEFRFGSCSLYRLVVLAAVVTSTRPNYQLLSAQCYCFASTVWEFIQRLDPTAIHVLIVPNLRGRLAFFRQRATKSLQAVGRFQLESTQETSTPDENCCFGDLSGDALIREILLLLRSRQKRLSLEAYRGTRGLHVFSCALGSYKQSPQALDQPLRYSLNQLLSQLQRSNREAVRTKTIYISSAEYCKQTGDAEHEFLLLEVQDERIPQISNWVVLDRTVGVSTPDAFEAASTDVSSGSPARDRLRVSCYGKKDLLAKQCSLAPYDILERVTLPTFASSTPLLLCELVIFALEASRSRFLDKHMSAQCFWFTSCAWECILKLQPEAYHLTVAYSNNRGKFGNFFRQDVANLELDDIFYKAESETKLFRMELARGREMRGRAKINTKNESLHHIKAENDELRIELKRLQDAADQGAPARDESVRAPPVRDPPVRVTPWSFTAN